MPWFLHDSSPDPIQVAEEDLPAFLATAEGNSCEQVPPPPWKPRASALGGYAACLYRAACDRAHHEERGGWRPQKQEDTSHADLGTCCHFYVQDGIRATFPGPASQFQPAKEEWESAAKLFGGDLERTQDAARRAATVAATLLPKLKPGETWLAEEEWDNGDCTGHTDLRTNTGRLLVDLKFTSKPPPHNRVKPAHKPQMGAYTFLPEREPEQILVIYVDKMKAAWGCAVPIITSDPTWQWYTQQMRDFCTWLRSEALFTAAVPNVGDQCSDLWCPYTSYCSKMVAQRPGQWFDALKARTPTGPISFAVPKWAQR